MEPKSSPESFPQMPRPVELPTPVSPEHLPSSSPERAEPTPEGNPERVGQAVPAVSPPGALPIPVVLPATQTVDDATSTSSDDNPAVAADEDLIEKEWVDKAKKVIAETRDDPHKREQAVGKLQSDYLKKRYGKELGSS